MRRLRAVIFAAGCTSTATPPAGDSAGDLLPETGLQLEIAPPGGDYGELRDGAQLWCGIPPQGGAPFSPILLRLRGPVALGDGVAIEAIAADTDTGEPLVYTALALDLLLSNVGESAGAYVGPEVHLRYEGWPLEALDGREAALVVRATALSDPNVFATVGALVELTLD